MVNDEVLLANTPRLLDDSVESRVELALVLEVLDDRLDDQIAVGKIVQIRCAGQPPQSLLFLVCRQLALADGFVEGAPDAIETLGEELVIHLSGDRFVARLGADLGDSRTHQTTTDNTDLFDLHNRLSSIRVRYVTRGSAMASVWDDRSAIDLEDLPLIFTPGPPQLQTHGLRDGEGESLGPLHDLDSRPRQQLVECQ